MFFSRECAGPPRNAHRPLEAKLYQPLSFKVKVSLEAVLAQVPGQA